MNTSPESGSGMEAFLINVLTGFCGNLAFLAALGLVAWGVWHRKRRLLERFFLGGATRKLFIMLSRIQVNPQGAQGVSGGVYSFAGATVAVGEQLAAQAFKAKLTSPFPGLADTPGILRRLVLQDIEITIQPSPTQHNSMPTDGAIITLGSPAFNVVSRYAEQTLNSRARFVGNNARIHFDPATVTTDPAVGLVTRLFDSSTGQLVFYVAGPSEEATVAGLLFLAENWRTIAARCRLPTAPLVIAVRAIFGQPLRAVMEFDATP